MKLPVHTVDRRRLEICELSVSVYQLENPEEEEEEEDDDEGLDEDDEELADLTDEERAKLAEDRKAAKESRMAEKVG